MKRKLYLITSLQLICIMIANAQTNPVNQLIVYFKTGVTRIPPSDSAANITSTNIQNVLHTYSIPYSNVLATFPSFNESDTVNSEIGESSRQMDRARAFTITLTLIDSTNKANCLNALNTLSEVLFAYQNTLTIGDVAPNDQYYSQQWGLNNPFYSGKDIHAQAAWDIYKGNPNSIIAIIDYGVDNTQNDLSAKINGGDQGFSILTAPGIQVSHGTAVAGIAAASTNNTTGIAGVDWYAKIYPKHAISSPGETPVKSDADVAQGIIDAVNYSPNVWTLNNSYENDMGYDQHGAGIPGAYSVLIRSAFAWAYRNNRVSIASMGNFQVLYDAGDPSRYANHTSYPAGFNTGIISVGGTKTTDEIMQQSAQAPYIDVVAPGNSIYTTNFNNAYIPFSGTSAAAPYVSGIASLIKGYNPSLANDDIEQIIDLSTDHLPTPQSNFSNTYGNGRVNAQKALQSLQSPNTLQHLSATGGTVYSTTANETRIFLGVPNFADAAYIVKRSEVRKTITLPSMCSTIGVWGRGVGTTGYREENGRCFGEGICEIVPGTLTSTNATLRTYVYEIWGINGQYYGFSPSTAANTVFQYTILGVATPTTINGDNTVCTTSNNYTIPNLPVGATVQWQVTPSGIATINTPNNSQTTLTQSGNGIITLTAIISNACGGQIIISKQNIQVGTYSHSQYTIYSNPSPICFGYNAQFGPLAGQIPNATSYSWIYPSGGLTYVSGQGTRVITLKVPIYNPNQTGGDVGLGVGNPCGVSSYFPLTHFNYSGCSCCAFSSFNITASPNPATNNINVSLSDAIDTAITTPVRMIESQGKTILTLYDFNTTMVVKQWTHSEVSSNNYNLNLDGLNKGVYVLQVDRDTHSKVTKIIVE